MVLLAFQEQQLLPLHMYVAPHSTPSVARLGWYWSLPIIVITFIMGPIYQGFPDTWHSAKSFQSTVILATFLGRYYTGHHFPNGDTAQSPARHGIQICRPKATLGLKGSTPAFLQLPLGRQSYSQEIMLKCIHAYVRRIPLTARNARAALAGIAD